MITAETEIPTSTLDTLQRLSSAPPSRETNPFATCWTSPGKIPFVEIEDQSVCRVLQKFEEAKGWGAVVGAHGSGKTTLLHALEAKLIELGRQVSWIHLCSNQSNQVDVRSRQKSKQGAQPPICLLEGFERLGRFARHKILWQCYRSEVEVIVTMHDEAVLWPWRLPSIATLSPSLRQIEQIFNKLVEREPAPCVSWPEALQALDCAQGNLREFWFELYMLYEERRR